MSKLVKLLLVEDSEDDARLVVVELKRGGFEVRHERVESAVAMSAALKREAWDAVISDYNMPGFSGLDALGILRSTGLDIPFILISGTVGEEIAVDAMKAGASDYVLKANLSRLAPVLERELADAAMRISHRRSEVEVRKLSLAIRQSGTGIVITDPTGAIEFVNPKFEQMSGYSAAEVIGKNPRVLRSGVTPLETYRDLWETITAGREWRGEIQNRTKKGDFYWERQHISPVFDGDGGIVNFIAVKEDVTDLKRAEHESHRFRMAMDVSADSIYLTDPASMRFVYLNDTACQRLGYSREQLLQLGPQDVLPMAREEISREYDDVISAGEQGLTHEHRFVRSDGSDGWTELRRRALRTADMTLIVTIGRDITERKRAEQRIGRLNRIYAVLSGINSAIVRVSDRETLLQEACRIAVEHGGFGIAQILLVDEDTFEILPGSSAGIDKLPAVRASFRPGAETISMQGTTIRAIRMRKPVFTNDISAEPPVGALRQEALRRGYGSVISLPLTVGERIVAVLLLCAMERNFFNDEELQLLNELAGDVSFALDHIEKADQLLIEAAERLRAESRVVRLNRVYAVLSGINSTIVRVESRDELFKEACRIAVEAGGFMAAWIGMVDGDADALDLVAWQGLDEEYIRAMPVAQRAAFESAVSGKIGLAPQAIMQKKPMIAADMTTDSRILLRKESQDRGFRSLAILPLIISGEAVGVLALYAAETNFFDAEEMKLLIELAGDISFALDHIEKARRLDYLAYYDALTGLANRSLFHERLNQHAHAARQCEGKLALVLLDVERFKPINDSLGRHAGDELLKQLASRLGQATDPGNIARVAGDHFALVLPDIKGRSEAARGVERIWRECFAQSFQVGGTELWISAKAGIALFPSDGADAETLLANAEAALQKAQKTGERHQFHTPELTAGVADQLALENRLRRALEKEEFVLYYQPKVELETREIVGVEALIRWQSPDLGLVPPLKFIPLMEETGLILEVGAWALRRASLDHRSWVEQGLKAPRVAVNVSPIQLRQRDFVAVVEQAIVEGGAPTGIDLEITESLIMDDVQGNITKLKAARQLGMEVAIDDFGTGYSSLGYLAKLPVQTLKIDRSFIITMLNDADTMTLVQTIISLAHSLRLKVVAEGVDAEDQAKMLRLLSCDQMQGFLFSKPVPFQQMTDLLKQGKKS